MQAIQKFIQLTFILVVTLTLMGMRVKLDDCHGEQEINISLSGSKACCCEETAPATACHDITCIAPAFASTFNYKGGAEQQVIALKSMPATTAFSRVIRPVLLAKIPHFTLPPPASGRFLGILHQTFII